MVWTGTEVFPKKERSYWNFYDQVVLFHYFLVQVIHCGHHYFLVELIPICWYIRSESTI